MRTPTGTVRAHMAASDPPATSRFHPSPPPAKAGGKMLHDLIVYRQFPEARMIVGVVRGVNVEEETFRRKVAGQLGAPAEDIGFIVETISRKPSAQRCRRPARNGSEAEGHEMLRIYYRYLSVRDHLTAELLADLQERLERFNPEIGIPPAATRGFDEDDDGTGDDDDAVDSDADDPGYGTYRVPLPPRRFIPSHFPRVEGGAA